MAKSSLPKFRWLFAGALAAGIWVVVDDMHAPRPPARISGHKAVAPKARPAAERQAAARPTAAKPDDDKPALTGSLPEAFAAPPSRPSRMITGAIGKPDQQARLLLQTTSRVRLRSRAAIEGRILAQLEAGRSAREIARLGKWRLVDADGIIGWIHADYLVVAKVDPLRPKASVPGPGRQSSEANAKSARAN